MKMEEARLGALQAVLQNVVRSWGEPPDVLLSNLVRTREALTASALQQNFSDAAIQAFQGEFDIMIRSLQARAESRPDTRPDPIP